MQTLTTIEKAHHVFETKGSTPILVTCDDLNEYVCKFSSSPGKLFNEYLGSEFCKLWEIPTPETCFIKVLQDHIYDIRSTQIQPRYFNNECFGSKYLPYAKDVEKLFESFKNSNSDLNKIENKTDFLKIALFDIWVSNEDRNNNNFNLLLNPTLTGNNFYTIDHSDIFNSNTLERGIYQISEEESILNADFAKVLYRKSSKLNSDVESLLEIVYICVLECRENLDSILSFVPLEWGINIEEKNTLLQERLFSDQWLEETIDNFKYILSTTLINRV